MELWQKHLEKGCVEQQVLGKGEQNQTYRMLRKEELELKSYKRNLEEM